MDKKTLIIANWKCNPSTRKELEHLFNTIKQGIENIKGVQTVICAPFVWLWKMNMRKDHNIIFGAQDCFWKDKGPYTGEVSPAMLKDIGCQYVIVGHSERRKYFKETDARTNKKILAILKKRLKPIFCFGEEVRDAFTSDGQPINEMNLAVADQLTGGLNGVSSARIKDIVFSYEPVWAISTQGGLNCSSDDAMKAGLFVRKVLTNLYSRQIADKATIIYGGSVDSKNVRDYIRGANLDGVLVGGASLNASEFIKVIKNASL